MPCFGSVGGEKNRLMLAVALAQPSNFLVLDEPTNDLDMDTLDLLQEVLDDYAGTVLLVSHDRDFIDRVVTSVIYMPGDGTVYEHAGSYSDLLAQAFCPYCRCAGQKTAQTRNLPPVRSGGTGQDCPPQLQSTASVGGSSL